MARQQSGNSYDPRKAEWNGISIEKWEPSEWKKWKPKATGTDYPATIEREYLRIRYAVQQANAQLDIDKVKIKLKLTNHRSIGLQGTYPLKPEDTSKDGSPNKQYTISLGIPATDAGVKTAIAKVRELDQQLWNKVFHWTPELLGKQAQKIAVEEEKPAKLISELIKEYEKEYWKTHDKDTRQSHRTWLDHYWNYLKKLPQNTVLSNNALAESLKKTKPNSVSRKSMIWQLKKFCQFCGFDGVEEIDSYDTGKPQLQERIIPSDKEILENFNRIGTPLKQKPKPTDILPEQWQWLYGMMATYGLRDHEVFAIDLESFINPLNTLHLITLNPELTEGTKTGKRKCEIPPLHPEWVGLFNLKNPKPIKSRATLQHAVGNINKRFRLVEIFFKPYSLRHAYAIRGHKLRIPPKTMADYMGHTVQEHSNSYQRWMDKETNIEIYKEVVLEKNIATKEDLKAENTILKTQIVSLQAEIESLKALLIQCQLGEILDE